MAKVIADFLQRQPLVDQTGRASVPEGMGSMVLERGGALSQLPAHDRPHCPIGDRANGASQRQKDLSVRGFRSDFFQVPYDRRSNAGTERNWWAAGQLATSKS